MKLVSRSLLLGLALCWAFAVAPRVAVAQSDTFYAAAPDVLYRGTIVHSDDTGSTPQTNTRTENIWQSRYYSNNSNPFIFDFNKSVSSDNANGFVFGGVVERVTVKAYAKAPKSTSFGMGRISWGVTRFVDSASVSGTPGVINPLGNGNPSAQVSAGYPRFFSSEADADGLLTIRTNDGTTKNAVGSVGASFFSNNLSFSTPGTIEFPDYPGVKYVEIFNSSPSIVTQSPFASLQFAVQSLPNRQDMLEIGSGSASIKTRSLYIADYEMVRINSAKMIDKETLQVKFSANYFTWENPAKTIVASGIINGRVVSKSVVITNESIENSIDLNLRELNVPRFESNQKFKIRLAFGDNANVFDEGNVFIPLPVIIVPGILNDGEGDGEYDPDFEYRMDINLKNLLSEKIYMGMSYKTILQSQYPTLATLSYNSTNSTFQEGGNSLGVLINNLIITTYANKFNIVTHSKGGIVARYFISNNNQNHVKELITTAPPNTGTILASIANNYFWRIPNLRPTWKWYRRTGGATFQAYNNFELSLLNTQRFPASIPLKIVYSNSIPITSAVTLFLPSEIILPGDNYVPEFSLLGYVVDMNQLSQIDNFRTAPRINAFQNIDLEEIRIPGDHVGYLRLPDVIAYIFNEFTKDLI